MTYARMFVTGMAMALASTTLADQTIVAGDFNGDGKSDLAVGAPYEDVGTVSDSGAVHVFYARGVGLSSKKDDYWHQNKNGVPDFPEFGDHFGRTLAAGDFNGDGFDDLAIATDEDGSTGSVHIFYGRANGLVVGGTQVLTQADVNDNVVAADGFGRSLTVGDFDNDGFDDLAVGEPFDTVKFVTSAGSVSVFYGSNNGLGAHVQWWHQHVSGINDLNEFGDNFGTSLAAGDYDGDGFDDLAIGVPGENVGQVQDAGMVHILFGSADRLTTAGAEIWQQNTPGIADKIEAGDRFGQSLAAGDFNNDGRDDLAIGAPGEKIDAQPRAGAVHVLYGSNGGLRRNGDDYWHQNRGGIEDSCETDDDFGSALAAGDFNGDGRDDLAIGARNESLDDGEDELEFCGVIHVLYGTPSGLKTNHGQLWHLDQPSMPGDAENSRFGSSLCVGDFDGDGFDDLAGAAPTETVDAVEKAGAVHVLYGSAARLIATHPRKWWHQAVAGVADEPETNDAFGGSP